MKNYDKELQMRDGREIATICGSPENLNTWIYRIKDTGVYVHEICIEGITPGRRKTDIVQITDVHLNYVNEEDRKDEEVMYTSKCRAWNAGGVSVKALKGAMDYAKDYDRTIITGDTLDYLSCGAMELMQKYIWDVDPACVVTLGGHDITKQMQTGRPDRLPLAERQAILESFWKHDMYYFSEVLHENVMLIQLDNGCSRYWDFQIPKLQEDLIRARREGYTVLIFQHEPICTGRPEDAEYPAYYVWADCAATENFYDKCVGYEPKSDEATMQVYRLITENADIVKGIFCGHCHTCFYTEVEGSYKDEFEVVHKKTIPQYLLECNVYEGYTGHVLKITVV